jgi:selenocysteine lyase/cysteine desulfurase
MPHTITLAAEIAHPTAQSLAEAEAEFRHAYPEFASTLVLDELRATDYARLDKLGHVYLDYTGGGLYADSQVRAHQNLLMGNVFGNPHSTNPTSQAATELVEGTRRYILEFFNAAPEEYVCIFTQNASGALKLVGESYPFAPGGRYLLTFDNHNSVNGIREFARAKGATVTYTPVLPPDLRIDAEKLALNLQAANSQAHNLCAFPAQSNFSGVQHSLEWVGRAQALGWDVLLDGAAFAPTNRLNLSEVKPEFLSLSFYKMFGYPTGVGALLAKRSALKKLHRPWFAGGTISFTSVQGDRYFLHEGAEAFEDGTLDYINLPAVEIGLRHLSRIGVETIHTRVASLTDWLLGEITALQHSSGVPVVKVYGPTNTELRGGTVTMNFFDADGHFIDHRAVEQRANAARISLRTGCFCNPGGGELALGISAEELSSCMIQSRERMTLDDFRRCIDDKSTGAVRVSVGLATTFADVYHFIQFAKSFVDKRAAS